MKLHTLHHPAFITITKAETCLNDLLPVKQLKDRPPAALLTAAAAWSEAVWVAAEQMEPLTLSAEQISQGLRLAQNPVFICGVHRSGTTLARDILDAHPHLVVLPSEGTYYTNIEAQLLPIPEKEWAGYLGKEWLRRLANPINQPPYWLLGRSTVSSSPYVNFARYLRAWWLLVDRKTDRQWPHSAIVLAYASCINHLSARYWVDKTPTNERFLERIRKEMPSSKIIQLIREPLATIASHKKMDPSWNFRHALRDLKKSFTIAGNQLRANDPEFLLLRYEDVCNEPEKTVAKLSSFLDIELTGSMKRPTIAGMPSSANSSFDKQSAAGVIHSPQKPLHEKTLSESEQQLISAYLGKLIVRHNYPFTKIGFIRKIYLHIKYWIF